MFDTLMGPKQVLLLPVRVEVGVMTTKCDYTLTIDPKLEPHQMSSNLFETAGYLQL